VDAVVFVLKPPSPAVDETGGSSRRTGKDGNRVLDNARQTLTGRTVTPEAYARLVAEDHDLSAEFAQLSAVNDTTDALQVVAEAAADILGGCIRMPTPKARHLSLLMSLKVIEHVAERSDQRGDEVQAAWCTLLHHKLLGGEWPSG
jgi:hypothetical protein